VRRTARRHGIHSEASYRFERGVDRDGIVRAADRAARLIAELAGGEIAAGRVEARGDAPVITEAIELSVDRANRLLGLELSVVGAKKLLERVGILCGAGSGDLLHCSVPSHRNDLQLPQDLIEEIARVHGYDRIPATLPIAPLLPATLPRGYEIAEQARDALAALGLTELVSFPFLRPEDLDALQLEAGDPRRQTLRVTNPIQEGESRLRTTLLPSLLRIARQNLSRQLDGARVFEVTRVFLPQGDNASELPAEPLRATVVLAEGSDRHLWDAPEAPPLFFQARGIAERLLSALGYVACLRRLGSTSYLHPGAEAELTVQGRPVGVVGELHPEVARQFEIEMACAVIEIDLEVLLSMNRQEQRFREVSREPSVRRDIAVLLDASQASGEVVESIRRVAGSNLISVEIFDRYQGKGVPEGRVSLAFRMVFQRADRTLTDAEVTKMMDRVVRTLTERFGAELR
jgi:phenylalanyl-tRNA synthetase beta chain